MNTRLLATLLLLFAAISLTAAETRKPNVLVFLSDDVGKNGRGEVSSVIAQVWRSFIGRFAGAESGAGARDRW